MRSSITLFFLLIISLFISAQSDKILFIGNSYTSVNNLPELISMMMTSSGDDIDYQMSAPGGCTFQQHCTVSSSFIQQGGWDYVVLQEQSQLPSFPESQFMQESYPYAASLCSMIRDYNPDAQIVFYMTWGRKNGDQQNCPYYPPLCTYQGMDSLLNLRYMLMSEDNNAWVSPVGAAWHYIRDHYSDFELYQSDESHPSYLGSYVAACCFHTIITGRDPLSITWNGSLDETSAQIVKDVVKHVVYDSLSKWRFETDSIPDDIDAVYSPSLSDRISIYPNPANSTIRLTLPALAKKADLSIFDMCGKVVYRQTGIVSGEDINVSFLKEGTYLLSVWEGNRRHVKLFSIIR